MKNIISFFLCGIVFANCNSKSNDGSFTVHGNVKNIENQKVFLEQLYFSPDKNPEVLDTANIINGKFDIGSISSEDGLYRLRFEKNEIGYVFINDKSSIDFNADANNMNLNATTFNTPANKEFNTFLSNIDAKQKALSTLSSEIEILKKNKKNDTAANAKIIELSNKANSFKKYIVNTIDSAKNPVVAIFALGYTRGINPDDLKTTIPNLEKRFSTHQGVASIIKSYNEMMVQKDIPPAVKDSATNLSSNTAKTGVAIGNIAPDFTLADVDGKPFTLSSLKGKYVLVDFWASWCGPCRGENPNVVANYNAFKNKNFTILGVSLDEEKAAWLTAIKTDKLTWKHVSDLKGWGSSAAKLYGVEAIPFNILLDTSGKIIAKDLREDMLGKKLTEVLK